MNYTSTRGKGKSRTFGWEISAGKIRIESERDIEHQYSVPEVSAALMWLFCKFGDSAFPLANNVEKLGKGEEKDGLGSALLTIKRNTTYAQGSSYLGVVLEQLGVLEFVEGRVISWHLNMKGNEFSELLAKLARHA